MREDRELRRQIFTAYITRGSHGDATDNRAIAARTAALRTEKARLLGYETWADYVLEENMAKTPDRVYELLNRLWGPAKSCRREGSRPFQQAIKAEGKDFRAAAVGLVLLRREGPASRVRPR